MANADIAPWRCHVCGNPFSTERGGLCRSCGRATCDSCWGDRPAFLSARQLPRQCKPCVAIAAEPAAGEQVILLALPPGFENGLPDDDVRAIRAMVGQAVLLLEYDEDGRALLEFDDPFDGVPGTCNHTHTIWVTPQFIKRYRT